MKILILNTDIIFEQVARALLQNGHEVLVHSNGNGYHLSPTELGRMVEDLGPDFCLFRNRRVLDRGFNPFGPQVEAFLQDNHIPHVAWFTENPLSCGTMDSISYFFLKSHPQCLTLTFSEESALVLQKMGHKAHYLPVAVTPEIFHPGASEKEYEYDISFIGRPKLDLSNGRKGRSLAELILPGVLSRGKNAMEFFSSQIMKSLAEQALETLESDHSADLAGFDRIANAYRKHLEAFLMNPLETGFMVLSARLGMFKVLSWLLDSGFRLQLFGGREWSGIFPSQKDTPEIDYEQQPDIYIRSRINLVITKYELRDVPHERILNIAACRAFGLSDYRPSVRKLFSEEEVPCFSTREELLEKARYYLDHEGERLDCIERAHNKVLEEHSFQVRMGQLTKIVSGFLRELGAEKRSHVKTGGCGV